MIHGNPETAVVNVELFGQARLATGIKTVTLTLPSQCFASDLAAALRTAVPELDGLAVDDEGVDLMSSYTANVNGRSFLEGASVRIADGDRIFVFSSQAGG